MAFVDNSQLQDPNNPQQPQNAGANNAQAPSTSSGSVANAPVQATGQGVASQPVSSKAPQYNNLSSYLSANAPQTAQMGQQVGQNLTNQANQTKSAIDSATNDFNGAVKAGTTSLDQNLLNQATSNPTDFVKNPQNVSTFQNYLNAQYKGPTDFTQSNGYGALNSRVENAAQTAANTSSPGGLQTLISGQEVNPTAGTQNLDALLLKQSPDAQSAIKAGAAPLNSLGSYFTGATNNANSAAANAAQITAAVAPAVHAAIDPVAQKFQQGITSGQKTADAQRTAYNQNLAKAQATAAGIEPNLQTLLDTLPPQQSALITDYYKPILGLQPNVQAATLENTATPQQFAEDAALQQLLGTAYTPTLNPALANQAGTYTAPTAGIPDLLSTLGQEDQSLANWAVRPAVQNQLLADRGLNPEATALGNLGTYLKGQDPAYLADPNSDNDLWDTAWQNANLAQGR